VPQAQETIGVDELQHRNLLALDRRYGHRGGVTVAARPLVGQAYERLAYRLMCYVAGPRLLDLVEPPPPFRGHGFRVLQPGLVQLLDERRVAAEQVGAAQELFHLCGHYLSPQTAKDLDGGVNPTTQPWSAKSQETVRVERVSTCTRSC
jgi:hypothetical protein